MIILLEAELLSFVQVRRIKHTSKQLMLLLYIVDIFAQLLQGNSLSKNSYATGVSQPNGPKEDFHLLDKT